MPQSNMNTSIEDNLSQSTPLEVAYARTASLRAALVDDSLVRQSVDSRRAATIAAGGYLTALPILADLAGRLPSSDFALSTASPSDLMR